MTRLSRQQVYIDCGLSQGTLSDFFSTNREVRSLLLPSGKAPLFFTALTSDFKAKSQRVTGLEDAALIFALRGVEKESSSAMPNRQLIDWHCWLAENSAWFNLGFTNARLQFRASVSNLQHELILRAVRGRSSVSPEDVTVLDATAGLARDAWIMASAGFQVEAVERIPVLATMLADSLNFLRRRWACMGGSEFGGESDDNN